MSKNVTGFKPAGVKLPYGTMCWSAPEVLKGENGRCSADIWSLGICLLEMVLFKLPFAEASGAYSYVFR